MIDNFKDHAANERTYLAWVRTSLAIIAFAIIIEKFNLVIHSNISQIEQISEFDIGIGAITVVLILTGLFILVGSTYRFMKIRQYLNTKDKTQKAPYTINLLLAILLISVTVVGMFYSLHILKNFF